MTANLEVKFRVAVEICKSQPTDLPTNILIEDLQNEIQISSILFSVISLKCKCPLLLSCVGGAVRVGSCS